MNLSRQAPVVVTSTGGRAAEGPLTLGQRNILQWLETIRDHQYSSLQWTFEVPPGTTVDDVLRTFEVLLARHEGLRSSYRGGTAPSQRVAADGELAIEVYAIEEADPVDAAQVATELAGRLLAGPVVTGLAGSPVLRVALATAAGTVTSMVARYSHLTVDFQAMAVLGREFTHLVGDPTHSPGPAGHQPLDQAAVEADPRLRPRLDAALRYWQRELTHLPPRLYPGFDAGPQLEPGAVLFQSPAGALALSHLARRTGETRSTIVLAALCAVLAQRTGYRGCRFPILSGNRYEPQLVDYVGTLVQGILFAIEVTGLSFDGLVRRAFGAMLNASRHGFYDVYRRVEISERLRHDRGVLPSLEPLFNNLVPDSPLPPPAPTGPMPSKLPVSELHWQPIPSMTTPTVFELWQLDEVLMLRAASGDCARAELESVLLATERLLVAAAPRDLDEAAMCTAIGLAPLRRDPGWLFVDSCWVELAQVQRLLDIALAPGSTGLVAAVDGRLVAYLCGIASPELAHLRCLAALPSCPLAMAPRHYVSCAGAPDDPADLAAWQRRPVLAEGAGR